MKELTTIPRYLGRPLYPMGTPLKSDQHSVESLTIGEIFFKHAEGKASEFEEKCLKEYIIYYVNAPIFDSEFSDELRKKPLMSLPIDDLIMECIEYGLDPF